MMNIRVAICLSLSHTIDIRVARCVSLSHLWLPDGLDQFGVRKVEGAGDLLGGEPRVHPLLTQVRVSLIVLQWQNQIYKLCGNPGNPVVKMFTNKLQIK